eukprot:TRINITY_DN16859_c0_g1_i1.p1 TRINITY_DN16859_c0_g1~~TRINITY_DN16859_c0_g1_i1.p1  ORF type:complete len:982 (+),score=205.93 TRINITY_DN16859_c0_g1_i1:18-2963(+)
MDNRATSVSSAARLHLVAWLLLLTCWACWILGVSQPIVELQLFPALTDSNSLFRFPFGNLQAKTTVEILRFLLSSGYYLAFGIQLACSVVLPGLKLSLVSVVLLCVRLRPSATAATRLLAATRWLASISTYELVDLYVGLLFIAFCNSECMDVHLGVGFPLFAAYVVLSQALLLFIASRFEAAALAPATSTSSTAGAAAAAESFFEATHSMRRRRVPLVADGRSAFLNGVVLLFLACLSRGQPILDTAITVEGLSLCRQRLGLFHSLKEATRESSIWGNMILCFVFATVLVLPLVVAAAGCIGAWWCPNSSSPPAGDDLHAEMLESGTANDGVADRGSAPGVDGGANAQSQGVLRLAHALQPWITTDAFSLSLVTFLFTVQGDNLQTLVPDGEILGITTEWFSGFYMGLGLGAAGFTLKWKAVHTVDVGEADASPGLDASLVSGRSDAPLPPEVREEGPGGVRYELLRGETDADAEEALDAENGGASASGRARGAVAVVDADDGPAGVADDDVVPSLPGRSKSAPCTGLAADVQETLEAEEPSGVPRAVSFDAARQRRARTERPASPTHSFDGALSPEPRQRGGDESSPKARSPSATASLPPRTPAPSGAADGGDSARGASASEEVPLVCGNGEDRRDPPRRTDDADGDVPEERSQGSRGDGGGSLADGVRGRQAGGAESVPSPASAAGAPADHPARPTLVETGDRAGSKPPSRVAQLLRNPVFRVKAVSWGIWAACYFCVKSPAVFSYMRLTHAFEQLSPTINEGLVTALPAAVGDCASDVRPPLPCVGTEPLQVRSAGSHGVQDKVLVRWASGINTIRLVGSSLHVIPDSAKPIQVELRGYVQDLKMSIQVQRCLLSACTTMWDSADSCCESHLGFELVVATDCVTGADGGAELGDFKVEWFDIDTVAIKERVLGLPDEITDFTPEIRRWVKLGAAALFKGEPPYDRFLNNATFAKVVSTLWKYNTPVKTRCSDLMDSN